MSKQSRKKAPAMDWEKRQYELSKDVIHTVWVLKDDPAWMLVKVIRVSGTSTARPVREGLTVYEITHNGQTVCKVADTVTAAKIKAQKLIDMERSDKG